MVKLESITEEQEVRGAMDFLLETAVDEDYTEKFQMEIKRSGKVKKLTFEVSLISDRAWKSYQSQTNKTKKGGKIDFDATKFNELLVVNHCVNPSFRDAEAMKKLNVRTPEQLLHKTLKIGEVAQLAEIITSVSGFDSNVTEMVEEVKKP